MDLALNEYQAPTRELDPEPQLGDEAHSADLDAAAADQEAEAEADPKAELETSNAEAPVRHKNQRARAQQGTAHRRFNLGMATYVTNEAQEATGLLTDKRRERSDIDDQRVGLVTDRPRTLFTKHPEKPEEAQLFERKPGGRRVTHQRGTVDKANSHHVMDPEKLYIGSGPVAADIRQGGFGDCYFEAALLAVVNNDPGQIQKMIRMSGDTTHVTFHRFDKATGGWVPVIIRTSDQLLTRKNSDGTRSLVGAGVRVPQEPAELSWWADINGSTLEVHKRFVWEVALWAALIEKAFADFAEQYGQYGRGFDKDKPAGTGGYNIIASGGFTEDCFGMIYGNAAAEPAFHGSEFTTDDEQLLQINKDTLERLVTYEATRGNTGPGQTQGFLEASVDDGESVARSAQICEEVLQQLAIDGALDGLAGVLPQSDDARIARSLRDLGRIQLRAQLETYKVLLASYNNSDRASQDALATFAGALSTPDLYPLLWDDSAAACYRHLRESLGVICNVGTDNSPGRRMIYANHAYNVKSVSFKDRSGAALTIKPGEVAARLADIDALATVVVIENPHAGNEPNLRGGDPVDKRPDGRFELTLDQFLRHFSTLGIAAVTH